MDSSATADSIADGVGRSLDPRWITVQRIHGGIFAAIVTMASFVAVIVFWIASQVLFLGLLLLPAWAVLMAALGWQMYRWPPISYRFSAYRVDESVLEIQRGVYWRTLTSVPRSRIQHTDVSQGPLERRYGLGTLVVYTAGTQHSQVTLSGLDFTLARRIRAHLLPTDHSDAV
jgi:membrane protein YdbS with pleckstrin-like domain